MSNESGHFPALFGSMVFNEDHERTPLPELLQGVEEKCQ